MPSIAKYLIDAAAGTALFFALLVVFAVDYFRTPRASSGAGANTLPVVLTETSSRQRDPQRLRLAVVPTRREEDPFTKKVLLWDDMGKLLTDLGEGYRYDEITEEQILAKKKKLRDYDVLFLTCNEGGQALKDELFHFVSEGGILYASDWRYDAVAAAFPDMVAPALKADGAAQQVEADIVDPALLEAHRSGKIHLRFDLAAWKTAAFGGPRVKVLIKGDYVKNLSRVKATAPLMVKFTVGKGTVIFTSFHNEKQNSADEKLLLQYLVFSLTTAGIETEIAANMEKDRFTPQSSNLLSTPKKNQSIKRTYQNPHKADLRFALGFRNEGAKLQFHIQSPDGKEYTWEGTSTVILDVPGAAPGTWTYTVTDKVLPYENFPFTMTVGEKK